MTEHSRDVHAGVEVSHVDPLDASAMVLGLLLIFYGLTSYADARNPQLGGSDLVIGILFALGCIVTAATHSYLRRPSTLSPISKGMLVPLSLATVPAFYMVSYFSYLSPGQTSATLLGSLTGAYLLSRFKLDVPSRLKTCAAAILLGACVFFVTQDICFDTLTMAGTTPVPRIHKGERLFVNKLAFGVRAPFLDRCLLRWGQPARGDLVVFRLDDGRLWVKEVVEADQDITLVKDIGVVQRSRLVGRIVLLE